MLITDIKAPRGAHKKKRVVGRGVGSGRGKTSGRGNKGQGSRSGRHFRSGFEGGQMMLFRRLPKRGFTSRARNPYQIINVGDLNRFSKGAIVLPDNLFDEGLIKNKDGLVKLLGDGAISKALTVKVHRATGSAIKKVQEASGAVEILVAVNK
ncbi:MAG TPA: 50S ribosomal protein L15 [Candidatus Omnitrophica bacterium]|nr:50S ribosomal protein L15 [Candidatus Omnitrophota bacterium]